VTERTTVFMNKLLTEWQAKVCTTKHPQDVT